MDKLSPFHDKQIEKALIFGRLKKHVPMGDKLGRLTELGYIFVIV